MTKGLLVAVIFAACIGAAAEATAHAFLDHAAPGVGATLAAPPTQIRLWFTQELEPAFSGVAITDERGARFDAAADVDAANRALLVVALKPLHPGTYTVSWHVVSVDTHRTEGTFTFTVTGP